MQVSAAVPPNDGARTVNHKLHLSPISHGHMMMKILVRSSRLLMRGTKIGGDNTVFQVQAFILVALRGGERPWLPPFL